MDPCFPTESWDMPRHGKLYTPLTLNGNWFERRQLSFDLENFEHEETLAKQEAAKKARMVVESKHSYTEIGHRENGALYIEDCIHLSCIGVVPEGKSQEEKPALVVDVDVTFQEMAMGMAYAYASPRDTEPKGRSVFVLKSEDDHTYEPRSKRLRYGEPFYMDSVLDSEGLAWRLTSGMPQAYNMDLDRRKQGVWLHPFPTRKSLWMFQCIDRSLHPIMEGEFIDSRQPVLLIHLLTGRSLTIGFQKRFKNPYGIEYPMTCDQDFRKGKAETNNDRFVIRIISCPPWKKDDKKEGEFRADLEQQIDELKQMEKQNNPPTNRNVIGYDVDREEKGHGWYDHGLHRPENIEMCKKPASPPKPPSEPVSPC